MEIHNAPAQGCSVLPLSPQLRQDSAQEYHHAGQEEEYARNIPRRRVKANGVDFKIQTEEDQKLADGKKNHRSLPLSQYGST